eukprot:283075-Chlamydomonas_euryale.AAC.2
MHQTANDKCVARACRHLHQLLDPLQPARPDRRARDEVAVDGRLPDGFGHHACSLWGAETLEEVVGGGHGHRTSDGAAEGARKGEAGARGRGNLEG